MLPTDLPTLSKVLKHLCAFPLPQCCFGYYSGLRASKCTWLNIGEGQGGHITVGTKVWGVNLKNFLENSREAVSVSAICDEYCRWACHGTGSPSMRKSWYVQCKESEKGDGSYYLWKKLSESVVYIIDMSLGINIFWVYKAYHAHKQHSI